MTYADEGRRCAVPGCGGTGVARNQCGPCYQRWYKRERADRNRESQRRWRERTNYNAKRRKPKRTDACAVCGEAFTTSSANKLYCGRRCKQIAYRRRK
jgi:hypothetical protein